MDMEEKCEHDWQIWGVDNTTDKNIMVQCKKCDEIIDQELIPYNGHLPSAIFQGQGEHSWVCSPKCPKCNPPNHAPQKVRGN